MEVAVMDHPTRPAGAPEVTLVESAASALTDLRDLVTVLPPPGGPPAARAAKIADRLSEELAEISQMITALPRRPVSLAGYDWQLLAALRTSHASGEDVAETIAHGLARLAAELGSSFEVTRNRPGSWEADRVKALLRGTVGDDDQYLSHFGVTS
jgi:hypothetical protein